MSNERKIPCKIHQSEDGNDFSIGSIRRGSFIKDQKERSHKNESRINIFREDQKTEISFFRIFYQADGCANDEENEGAFVHKNTLADSRSRFNYSIRLLWQVLFDWDLTNLTKNTRSFLQFLLYAICGNRIADFY